MKVTSLRKIHGWLCAGLCVVLFLCFVQGTFAKNDKKEPKVTVESKSLQGEIGSINPNYISITYKREQGGKVEYDILLPIGEDFNLVHKGDLSELQPGDTVSIDFDEATEEYPDGKIKKKREAKTIRFIKAAREPGELRSMEEEQ